MSATIENKLVVKFKDIICPQKSNYRVHAINLNNRNFKQLESARMLGLYLGSYPTRPTSFLFETRRHLAELMWYVQMGSLRGPTYLETACLGNEK